MTKKSVAVFISGFGSNLERFLIRKDEFSSILVVSSKADAFGLVRAQQSQVPCVVLDSQIDWEDLSQKLSQQNLDYIFLAGFMKILPPGFVREWGKITFNLHPSMLPKYKGLRAIERAVEDGDDVGVTIHRVVEEVDGGDVVYQQIAVKREELSRLTLEQTKSKVHQLEHQLVDRWITEYCGSQH